MLRNELRIILAAVLAIALGLGLGCSANNPSSISGKESIQFQVNGEDNAPLQGGKVVSFKHPDGQLILSGLTDVNGSVIFKDILPGDYQFYVSRFDYYQMEVATTVIAGQANRVDIRMAISNPVSTTPAASPVGITFSQLIADPQKFAQQAISLQGFWFDGFEIVVLAERLDPSSFAAGNLQPAGTLIWIKGGLPEDVNKQLYLQPNNPTGYPAHYGKVEVSGILEYGSTYGHMNAYKYQLDIQTAKLISWNP